MFLDEIHVEYILTINRILKSILKNVWWFLFILMKNQNKDKLDIALKTYTFHGGSTKVW